MRTDGRLPRAMPGAGLRRRVVATTAVALWFTLAAGLAVMAAFLIGHTRPVGPPLFAAATLGIISSPHRRWISVFVFGVTTGLGIAAVATGYQSADHVIVDGVIGVAAALAVAFVWTARYAGGRFDEALGPLLSTLATHVRATAGAMRANDAEAAKAAVYALAGTDHDLRRLNELVEASQRSAFLTLRTRGRHADYQRQMAQEIAYAVRNIRVALRHVWWAVLRPGEQFPLALPQMLESLADGVSILRDELTMDGDLLNARPLLISAAKWIEVMRAEPVNLPCAAVAANVDAAVLNLLVATGLPLTKADDLLNPIQNP